ncbi:hypothetical protein ACVIWU_006570 [Bradyrhizobium sp. USDA 4509]
MRLRQSYLRLSKRAAIMVGRYTHAHQFKRARLQLKFLRTRLGRIIRDIRRKIDDDVALEAGFGPLLDLAQRVRTQDQHQRGPKVYALHPQEVECIGKGKARAPYEFGCKVSIAKTVTSPKRGQFVLHAKALHGNPFDGHTLGPVVADMEKLTGVEARRIHVDKGYRGHNHPHRFRVWISGQVRRVTASIRREMKRRAAVEPVIGHVKAEHRMDPQLSQRPRWRPHQCHPRCGRPQLRPAPAMARRTVACHHPGARRNCPGSKHRLNHRSSAFFTEDFLMRSIFAEPVSHFGNLLSAGRRWRISSAWR